MRGTGRQREKSSLALFANHHLEGISRSGYLCGGGGLLDLNLTDILCSGEKNAFLSVLSMFRLIDTVTIDWTKQFCGTVW
jgi:hypothetical protein